MAVAAKRARDEVLARVAQDGLELRNLPEALREYRVFVATSERTQYDHPNPLLVASFEHLCALGLVIATREQVGARPPTKRAAPHPPPVLSPARLVLSCSALRKGLALGHTLRCGRSQRHRGTPTEQLPLRLGTDAQTLHDFIKSHDELPTEVQRFGTQQTL